MTLCFYFKESVSDLTSFLGNVSKLIFILPSHFGQFMRNFDTLLYSIIKIFFNFFTSRRNDQQIEKGAALCLWSAEADGEARKLKLATRNLGQPLIFWTFALSQQAPDVLKITEADMCIIVWICWIFYFLSKNWKMTKTGKLRPKIGRQKLKDALFLLTRFTKYNS